MTFLCFQGKPSSFTSKDSILGGLRRRAEVRGSPGIKNKAQGARSCARTPRTTSRPAIWHGLAVPGGTTVPCGRCPGLICSQFFSFGDLSIPQIFPCFSSCFRVLERGLRESSNFRLGFEFMFFGLKIVKI